ncbi:preprotein translocase subunit YajC [Marinagarivorans cellulosilyticus]|uniref:Sec translocon accessory complex subunit YajC n=1 Tax=Marinagarivorans cellulosilyticus TaxID=2721545 RepID=A0AAN2BLF4_9GAMM|nr:preprotein translocase subunit YajC [Marinagarivorans cellulosilyticus]BCD98970.1 preprotein translocase subunit YajC [Marinagarivorans cellulosilyticus]
MSLLIPEAMAQDAGAQGGGDMFSLLMLVGLVVLMYFMMIRPQRKRQKEHEALVSGIAKGDEVVLTSGMLGKVVEVDESYIAVDTGEGVKLRFQKSAVHAVLPKGTMKSI